MLNMTHLITTFEQNQLWYICNKWQSRYSGNRLVCSPLVFIPKI